MFEAIFIDRDGTIGGGEAVEYPGDFKLFPHVSQEITRLRDQGILLCSFTNQPGISRGEATKVDSEEELQGFGFHRVYLCPHSHDEQCPCRKPEIGMLEKAAQDNDLSLQECVVIGDRWTDLLAAHRVGCKKVLVKTGAGKEAFDKYQQGDYYGEWAEVQPDYIAESFVEAVQWILQER